MEVSSSADEQKHYTNCASNIMDALKRESVAQGLACYGDDPPRCCFLHAHREGMPVTTPIVGAWVDVPCPGEPGRLSVCRTSSWPSVPSTLSKFAT